MWPERGPFVRPAMLFGNFQIIHIYVAKCLKKFREIIEPKLDDTQCGFRPGRITTDQILLSSKFVRNLGSMPKRSTYALSTWRKHTTGFLVKNFWEFRGSAVLTVPVTGGQVTVFLLRRSCSCRES